MASFVVPTFRKPAEGGAADSAVAQPKKPKVRQPPIQIP